MIRAFFLLVIMTAGGFQICAQFNDSTHYNLKYAATGTFNKTNDGRSYVFNNAASFTMNKKSITLNSSNNWIYGRQGASLLNNDFSSVLNFDINKNIRKPYYWGISTYTTSYSLKINHQFQGGAGLGYNFINREDFELSVTDGLLYETSDLELSPQVKDRYNTFRNSLRIRYHFVLNDIIILDGWHYWQPSLSGFDDYIVKSYNSLTLKLRKWLGVTTALNYNRLSRTNRENLLLNFGLTAETYF